jgi:hypothetical protein
MSAVSDPIHRRLRRPLTVALALLLAGCAAVAPPPGPAARPEQAPIPAPGPTPAPPGARAPAAPPPVVATPAPVRPASPAVALPPDAAASVPAAPYGPTVAARFPDPPQRYETPGLRDGNRATTQAELQQTLRALVTLTPAPRAPTVRLLALGASQRGTALEALLFTRAESGDASALVAGGRPTVLLIGQQHGDEPAGAEALLVVARELAQGDLAPLLDRINVIVLPRANPDGAEAGQRGSAGGIDINRDHLLLRTPEAQAIAQLARNWRPAVVVDAHEYTVGGRFVQKYGALQRYDALLQYATTANLPEFVTRASEEWFRRPLLERLRAQQLSAEWYYTTSVDPNDRRISMGGVQPDTGRNVHGLKNAVSLLIETRGVGIGTLHLQRRVHTHVTAARSVLASAAARAADLVKLRQFVDAEVAAKACQGQAVVAAAATPGEYRLTMIDPQTGADRFVTVDWDSALVLQPRVLRPRPCGYWLAAEAGDAVQRLRALGLQVQQVTETVRVQGDAFREVARTAQARQDVRGTIVDAVQPVAVQVELVDALIDMPAGSYYVPLTQPLANLAIAALEPDTQNSYVANRIVERTEWVARIRALPEGKLAAVP